MAGTDLMSQPGVGDLGSSSVSEDVVLHALNTWMLSDFGSIRWLVVLHFCKHKRDITLLDSFDRVPGI